MSDLELKCNLLKRRFPGSHCVFSIKSGEQVNDIEQIKYAPKRFLTWNDLVNHIRGKQTRMFIYAHPRLEDERVKWTHIDFKGAREGQPFARYVQDHLSKEFNLPSYLYRLDRVIRMYIFFDEPVALERVRTFWEFFFLRSNYEIQKSQWENLWRFFPAKDDYRKLDLEAGLLPMCEGTINASSVHGFIDDKGLSVRDVDMWKYFKSTKEVDVGYFLGMLAAMETFKKKAAPNE